MSQEISQDLQTQSSGFQVKLTNFDGPFDLLLSLIAKHQMEITEVALATVTDEFINYIKEMETSADGVDLDQTTEFLVVAATLLDLKAAKLLPSGQIDDEEDLALLEARDLLFARLLQYRAFKEIATIFATRIDAEEHYFARTVALEPKYAQLLPEVLIGVTPDRFAAVANRVLVPKRTPIFSIDHLHRPLISVADEGNRVVAMLRQRGSATFRSLVADADNTLVVIARFLAILELYKDSLIRFEQIVALGELHITWSGSAEGEIKVSDEFDKPIIPPSEESEKEADNGSI